MIKNAQEETIHVSLAGFRTVVEAYRFHMRLKVQLKNKWYEAAVNNDTDEMNYLDKMLERQEKVVKIIQRRVDWSNV